VYYNLGNRYLHLEAAHSSKLLASTPQRYTASHPIIQQAVIKMLMSETHISLSGTILPIKKQIKCDQILLKLEFSIHLKEKKFISGSLK